MTVDESLEAEGWAADVIRGLQDARKASNFEVSDRIVAELFVPEGKKAWADRHSTLIAGEVLATTFTVTVGGEGAHKVIEGVTADVTKA